MKYTFLPSLRHPAWGIYLEQCFNFSNRVPFPSYNTSPPTSFLLATVEAAAPDFGWCVSAGGRCLVVRTTFTVWTLCPVSCTNRGGLVLRAKSGPQATHGSKCTVVISASGCSAKSGSVAPICWQHGTKINYVLFCTSFLHFMSLLVISAGSEDSLKQMSISVAPPFCHGGGTWACIQLRKSRKLSSRKASSNYQINTSYGKYQMFKMASNQW